LDKSNDQKNQTKPTTMTSKFDINKSKVSVETLAEFLASSLSADITCVPGIGPSAASKLNCSTFQFIGFFLTLKLENSTRQEHCDAMWEWLREMGINTHRSGIVNAICEKCTIMIPSLYDEDDF